jgi:hypothetical protein
MPTIVEDNKRAHEKPACDNANWQREQVRNVDQAVRDKPQNKIRNHGVRDLPDTAAVVRALVFGN